jgi:hypothetical protein
VRGNVERIDYGTIRNKIAAKSCLKVAGEEKPKVQSRNQAKSDRDQKKQRAVTSLDEIRVRTRLTSRVTNARQICD